MLGAWFKREFSVSKLELRGDVKDFVTSKWLSRDEVFLAWRITVAVYVTIVMILTLLSAPFLMFLTQWGYLINVGHFTAAAVISVIHYWRKRKQRRRSNSDNHDNSSQVQLKRVTFRHQMSVDSGMEDSRSGDLDPIIIQGVVTRGEVNLGFERDETSDRNNKKNGEQDNQERADTIPAGDDDTAGEAVNHQEDLPVTDTPVEGQQKTQYARPQSAEDRGTPSPDSTIASANQYQALEESTLNKLPVHIQVLWVLFNINLGISLSLSLTYYLVMYRGYDTFPTLNTFLEINLHGLNFVLGILENFICSIPCNFIHFFHPLLFGVLYVFFVMMYYFSGGTEIIYIDIEIYPYSTVLFIVLYLLVMIPLCFFIQHLVCMLRYALLKRFNKTSEGHVMNVPSESA